MSSSTAKTQITSVSGPSARRIARAIAPHVLLVVVAVLAHSVFVLPRLVGAPFDYFAYIVGDSTTQLIPATELLERSLQDGNLFWSWSYGLGGDLFSQFSYYYSTSPFFYLQFAIKSLLGVAGADFATTELWRLVFSIVKLVLCMELMYALLKKEGATTLLALCGAMIYGGSPWFLDNSFAFDFMTDAMIWPPLIVMAYNRYRRRGSWIPLLAACALCLANSFYFGFIATLFLIIFGIVFSWEGSKESPSGLRGRLRVFARRMGRLALIYLGALGVASIGFLPGVLAVLSADRTQVASTVSLLPSLSFLAIVPEALFAKGGAYFATEAQTFAFPLAVLFACFISYRRVDDRTRRKSILALVLVVAWMVPLASSVANGLSYPSNRWCYLVVFAVAYAFPAWMDALVAQGRINRRTLAIAVGIVVACCATRTARLSGIGVESGYEFSGFGLSDLALLAGGIAFVILAAYAAGAHPLAPTTHDAAAAGPHPRVQRSRRRQSPAAAGTRPVARTATAASAAHRAQTHPLPSEHHPNAAVGPLRSRTAAASAAALALFVACELIAMPFGPYALASSFRDSAGAESSATLPTLNSLVGGSSQTAACYRTLFPGAAASDDSAPFFRVDDEETDNAVTMGEHGYSFENRTWDLGGRGVSAYNSLIPKSLNHALKYDYDITTTSRSASQYRGLGHRLFQESAWGVAYKLNLDQGTNLFGLENAPADASSLREGGEEAAAGADGTGIYASRYSCGIDLWYSAVVPQSSTEGLSYAQRDALLLQAGTVSDAIVDENGLAEASPDLSTVSDVPLSAQTVSIEGGTYENGVLDAPDGATIRLMLDPGHLRSAGEYLLTFTATEQTGAAFSFKINGEWYTAPAKNSRWGYPQTTDSICIPNNPDAVDIEVTPGTYNLSDVSLQFSSYDQLDTWYAQANSRNLDDLRIEANRVSGDLSTDESGVLALSIPYDSGWSCTIDGTPASTFAMNGAMTGVVVPAGSHHIAFTYRNRALQAGACITAIALAAVTAVALRQRKRR